MTIEKRGSRDGVYTFPRPLRAPDFGTHGMGDPTKTSNFACVADLERDDNRPPAPKYLDDGNNFPILPTDDHGHDYDNR
jgi:hypothetical protein